MPALGPRFMAPESQASVLVVVEGGAACQYWMDHWGPQPDEGWALLEQEAGESKVAFLERLSATLLRHRLTGSAAETLLFVAGERASELVLQSRRQLTSELLTHLAELGGGRLILSRGYSHDGRSLPELGELAKDLAEHAEDAGVELTMRPGYPRVPASSTLRTRDVSAGVPAPSAAVPFGVEEFAA